MTTITEVNETAQTKAVEPKATKKRRTANRPARVGPKKRTSRKKAAPASKTHKTHKTREVEERTHSSRPGTKVATILELLKRPGGTTLKELMKATGWQPHSVRGYLSGTIRKKLDLGVVSTKAEDGVRCYAIKA